jgi:hypothetical protein
MAALGSSVLLAGQVPQKPCLLQARPQRASRLARAIIRVEAVAAPPRQPYVSLESLSVDDNVPTATFTRGQAESVDAVVPQEPSGKQGFTPQSAIDTVGFLSVIVNQEIFRAAVCLREVPLL